MTIRKVNSVQYRQEEAQVLDLGNANQDRWNKARLLKMEDDLLYAAERILPLVVNQAMEGDVKAQKLIMDRTIPPLKAVTPPLPQGLPVEDLATLLQALAVSVAKGEASPTVALDFLAMVKQAAELKEGATPKARAGAEKSARLRANIERLELDMEKAGSTYTRKLLESTLARRRKELEEMDRVLDSGTLTLKNDQNSIVKNQH